MVTEKSKGSAVLTATQIGILPEWYPYDLKEALADPSADFLGAVLAVGRILRTGDGGGEIIAACKKWATSLSDKELSLLGIAAEQYLADTSQIVRGVTEVNKSAATMARKHFADDLVTEEESDENIVQAENDFADVAKTAHFSPLLIKIRDDAESLLFVLGIKALSGNEHAAFFENRIRSRANSVDRVCRVIEDVIADALAAAPKPKEMSWLPRIATLTGGQWWLDLMLVRTDRVVKDVLRVRQAEKSGVVETVRSLIKLPQEVFQSRDLLGRFAAALSSQGLAYVSLMGDDDLKAEIMDSDGNVVAQVVTENGETVIRSVGGPLSDEITSAVETINIK